MLKEVKSTLDCPDCNIPGRGVGNTTRQVDFVVLEFLTTLRDSADVMYAIYTEGSCYKLCELLTLIYPKAVSYWSDRTSHAIIQIEGTFYDIGGKISKTYVEVNGFFIIPEDQKKGYALLKYMHKDYNCSVVTEKYI